MKVAVNAGHFPGLDPGACGQYSREAEIVEKVAKIVCEDLNQVNYQTILIQENYLTLIAYAANKFEADAFVSIHCNSCESNEPSGTETFYADGSCFGVILAENLQRQLVDTMGRIDRGIKPDTERYKNGMTVLRRTEMPAALVELEFISNLDGENYLNGHIEEIAHALSRGITDYFNETEELEGKV